MVSPPPPGTLRLDWALFLAFCFFLLLSCNACVFSRDDGRVILYRLSFLHAEDLFGLY